MFELRTDHGVVRVRVEGDEDPYNQRGEAVALTVTETVPDSEEPGTGEQWLSAHEARLVARALESLAAVVEVQQLVAEQGAEVSE